jgi:hypothetical protein
MYIVQSRNQSETSQSEKDLFLEILGKNAKLKMGKKK